MRCVLCAEELPARRRRFSALRARLKSFSNAADFLVGLNLISAERVSGEEADACRKCLSSVKACDDILDAFRRKVEQIRGWVEESAAEDEEEEEEDCRQDVGIEPLVVVKEEADEGEFGGDPLDAEEHDGQAPAFSATDEDSLEFDGITEPSEPRSDSRAPEVAKTLHCPVPPSSSREESEKPTVVDDDDETGGKGGSVDEFGDHKYKSKTVYRCEECYEVFMYPAYLFKHYLRCHQRPDGHLCNECGRSFGAAEALREHEEEHWKQYFGRVSCIDCRRVLMTSWIRQHVRKFHRGRLSRTAAERKSSGNQYWKCLYCNFYCGLDILMELHAVQAHSDQPDQGMAYQCDQCPKRFKVKKSLMRHKQGHLGQSYQCSQCGRSFSKKDCFDNHMRRHENPSRGKALCTECGQEFWQRSLAHHMASKHGIGEITYDQCHLCPERFIKYGALGRHLAKAHGVGEYRPVPKQTPQKRPGCELCGQGCQNQDVLAAHMLNVHEVRTPDLRERPCRFCAKTFYSNTHLTMHLRKVHGVKGGVTQKHGGNARIRCKLCSVDFEEGREFSRHLRREHKQDVKGLNFQEFVHVN